jgi:hypothetical protein
MASLQARADEIEDAEEVPDPSTQPLAPIGGGPAIPSLGLNI